MHCKCQTKLINVVDKYMEENDFFWIDWLSICKLCFFNIHRLDRPIFENISITFVDYYEEEHQYYVFIHIEDEKNLVSHYKVPNEVFVLL